MKKIKKIYKYAVIATDIVIFTVAENRLKILLMKMRKTPYEKYWAIPGKITDSKKSIEDSAKDILFKITGLKKVNINQLYTFGEVKRDPFGRVVSVAYSAIIKNTDPRIKNIKKSKDINWFSTDNLPKLAYDHKKITKYAIKHLKEKLEHTTIINNLLPKYFTLTEMQNIYELILNKKLDKRNFRKKILSLNIIKTIGKKNIGKAHRPAELYEFVDKKIKKIQIL